MAFITLTTNGISRFVDENKVNKIKDIREKFLADVELDNSGNIKKYSSSEISDYLGARETKVDLYNLFNLTKPTINKVTSKKSEKTEK